MRIILPCLALTAVLVASLAESSQETELALGTWTGVMAPANFAATPATYDVEKIDGELTIKLHQPGGVIPLFDIHLDDVGLSFSMSGPGMTLVCALQKGDDGVYEGECSNTENPGAPRGRLTMVPPGKISQS